MWDYRTVAILYIFIHLCLCLDVGIKNSTYLISKSRITKIEIDIKNQAGRCIAFNKMDDFSHINSNYDYVNISDKDMDGVIRSCDIMHKHFDLKFRRGNSSNRIKRSFSLVYPGTKWCGIKNTASDYTDLGNHVETDQCCRQHDHCPESIGPFEKKYGLFNFALYSKCHCDCDDEFYNCLKEAGKTESAADRLGRLFFNVVEPQCIEEIVPSKICVCKIFGMFCCKYEENKSGRRLMDFVNNNRVY